RFRRLEREGAPLEPSAAEAMRDFVLKPELGVEIRELPDTRWGRRAAVEPCCNASISELGLVSNGRAINVGRCDVAVGGHGHLDDQRESVHALAEGREIG